VLTSAVCCVFLIACTPATASVPKSGEKAASTTVGAGSSNDSSDGGEWLTTGSAAVEYKSAISSIKEPMPAGVTYPPGLPKDFIPSKNVGQMQKGLAADQAEFTWLCAWETEYLKDFQDKDKAKLALSERMVTWWSTSPYYLIETSDPGHYWAKNVVDPMKLGDPAGVKEDHDHDCKYYPTVTTG
jgi:hypothetical protein